MEQIVANPVQQILDGVQHPTGARAESCREAGRGCASATDPGEIVELVAGEVVCNARTGVRRQHGWTCTNGADRGCSGTTDPGAER